MDLIVNCQTSTCGELFAMLERIADRIRLSRTLLARDGVAIGRVVLRLNSDDIWAMMRDASRLPYLLLEPGAGLSNTLKHHMPGIGLDLIDLQKLAVGYELIFTVVSHAVWNKGITVTELVKQLGYMPIGSVRLNYSGGHPLAKG